MKKEISRAYIASHILLRNKIFTKGAEVRENLKKGPNNMKKYLFDIWNSITNDSINQDYYLTDLDRKVTLEDFYVTSNVLNNNRVFYFTFPEPDSVMSQAKHVALAINRDGLLRYFTMEIKDIDANYQKKYIYGEWISDGENFKHINYGEMEESTIKCFVNKVANLLNDNKLSSNTLKEETLKLIDLNNASFKDLFSICIGKAYKNQQRFIKFIGKYDKWDTDVTTGVLKLDDRNFDVEYIGSTAPDIDNFWCSSEIEQVIPDKYVNLMIKTRKIMEELGLLKYVGSKIELQGDVNAFNLSMIYIAFAPENVTYFCGNSKTPIYMFVKNLPEDIFKKVGSAEFNSIVLDIISNFNVNQKLMIKAFLIENDCKYIEDGNNIIGIFTQESKITFKFQGDIFEGLEGNLS